MKRLLVYSKDYCGQITIAAISSVTASIATVFIIDILRQIIECISIGNLMQEVQNIILKMLIVIGVGIASNYMVVSMTGFVGVVLFVLCILGFVNWSGNFGVEAFDNFHTLITEDIKIEASGSGNDFFIFKDLLGTGITALGSWNNITISAFLIIFTIILALCYRFKMNDFIDAVKSGIKKLLLPSLCIIGAYMLMIVVYQSTYMATIVNKLLTLTDSFNIATMTLSSLLLNIFHTDLGFTGWVMGSYLPVEYVDYMSPVYTIFTSLYGFVQFFIPTSMVLGIGLVSLKVKFSDWLKYVWRFLLGMFICLLVIFILMTII